jgi:hypothetical protein
MDLEPLNLVLMRCESLSGEWLIQRQSARIENRSDKLEMAGLRATGKTHH